MRANNVITYIAWNEEEGEKVLRVGITGSTFSLSIFVDWDSLSSFKLLDSIGRSMRKSGKTMME